MKKFLLHTCCAPCSIAIIDELKSQFELTVFFYNPNIYPEAEYLKRKAEVIKVCDEWDVPMKDFDSTSATPPEPPLGKRGINYGQNEWHDQVAKGLDSEPEGGRRCPLCFKFRLAKTAEYAAQNGFEIFGTSLTSGRNKKADVIHPIGVALAKVYKIKFYEEDWKKNGRQEKGRKMVAERLIYRQNYCGCVYSVNSKFQAPNSQLPVRGR
ncbi:MAG: epoxyqueuosine reductase QueH [Candidatus Magasanikbacteria bacterium]